MRRIMAVSAVVTLLASVSALAFAAVGGAPAGNAQFQRTWARTDQSVAALRVSRSWVWGPAANTGLLYEDYAESPGGRRVVQYYDKSRMEITHPGAIDDGKWYVTNGLLVVEMVEGYIQTGDATHDDAPDPADVNIAGDPGQRPTYADIGAAGLRAAPAVAEGTAIIATFEDGSVGDNPAYANAGVTGARYVPETRHTVASVFVDYFEQTGEIFENGQYVTGRLFDPWFYASGYPITEAYWSRVAVGGQERDVLWQCFERRCLTYTPTNEPQWQIEMGNVGQHYFAWRYADDTPTPAPTSTPTPPPTATPTATPTQVPPTPTATPRPSCDPAYPTVCIPSPPPDLDCDEIPYSNFMVLPPDPHDFDRDGDGVGCEG